MNSSRDSLSKYGYSAIQLILLLILTLFVIGHCFGAALEGVRLGPIQNYISQYAVSSSKPYIFRTVILSFGLVLFFLAYCLLRRLPMSRSGRIGPLLLAISAATMAFVAVYPTRPVKPSQNNPAFLEYVSSFFTFGRDKSADSVAEAIASVHDTMIRVSAAALLSGIFFIAFAARAASPPGRYKHYVLGSALSAGLALLLSMPVVFSPNWIPGLWQRSSFFVLYLWVFGTVTFFKRQLGDARNIRGDLFINDTNLE